MFICFYAHHKKRRYRRYRRYQEDKTHASIGL